MRSWPLPGADTYVLCARGLSTLSHEAYCSAWWPACHDTVEIIDSCAWIATAPLLPLDSALGRSRSGFVPTGLGEPRSSTAGTQDSSAKTHVACTEARCAINHDCDQGAAAVADLHRTLDGAERVDCRQGSLPLVRGCFERQGREERPDVVHGVSAAGRCIRIV